MKRKSLLKVAAVVGAGYIAWKYFSGSRSKSSTQREYYIIKEVRRRFTKLDPKFGSIPIIPDTSSYTENKRFIGLCVKNPYSGQYYNIDTVMHVALHELTHILDDDYETGHNHSPEFHQKFNMILSRAKKVGIYNPNTRVPVDYCSM